MSYPFQHYQSQIISIYSKNEFQNNNEKRFLKSISKFMNITYNFINLNTLMPNLL